MGLINLSASSCIELVLMAEAPGGQPAPLKRSVFKRPAWSQLENSGNSTDFFCRSNQTYVDVAAEAERRRQSKIARRQKQQSDHDGADKPDHKRRRLSPKVEPGGDPSGSDGDEVQISTNLQNSSVKPHADQSKTHNDQRVSSPDSFTKRPLNTAQVNKDSTSYVGKSSNIVEVESDDEHPSLKYNDVVEVGPAEALKIPSDDEFPPSDDEYAELARKAREKARKRLETDLAPSVADPIVPPDSQDLSSRSRTRSASQPWSPLPSSCPDPVVQILLTSRIPNTNPLIVNRRVSQRLKEVRVAWCQRQGLAPKLTNSVYLTWRGKRLFDVTTCKSLGIGVDVDGHISLKGQYDFMGEEEKHIHMEAMTDDTSIEEAQQKMHQQQSSSEAMEETRIRIILKAKEFDDFKLIVKPVS